MYPCNLNCA